MHFVWHFGRDWLENLAGGFDSLPGIVVLALLPNLLLGAWHSAGMGLCVDVAAPPLFKWRVFGYLT